MKSCLHRFIHHHWQQRTWLSYLLYPLSLVYGWISCYRAYQQTPIQLPCPVIVVGNIRVGGTGKTPVTIRLIQDLQQAGKHPGVVSRGYGASIDRVYVSTQDTVSTRYFGDEACLIAPYAPIAVYPDRVQAAQTLLHYNPQIDVIIADDGLQHHRLGRDIELNIYDKRGVGNGFLLPAGPLRESVQRMQTVDFNLMNGASAGQLGFILKPVAFHHLLTHQVIPVEQAQFHGSITAIAGIGHPQRFFDTLTTLGLQLTQQLSFPDHHPFTPQDFTQINTDIILMTAKDAIKIQYPDQRMWFLAVQAQWTDPHFPMTLLQRLDP